MTVCLQYGWPSSAVVVVAFFSITGPSQTLIGQSTHFSLRLLLRDWRNPQQLRRFQRFNVPVDFFEFLPTEFAACSRHQAEIIIVKHLIQRRNNVIIDQGAG